MWRWNGIQQHEVQRTRRRASPGVVNIDQRQIAEFCRRHGIRKLALFGSVLREDFRPDSDVDILVEFAPDTRIGLIRLAALEHELSTMLQRKVDLRTPEELSRYFRHEVLKQAAVQYEQG